MYRWTRPQIAVPVHGEPRHMAEHARLARSLQVPQAMMIENGHMLRLAPGRAEIIDEVPAGRVYLDGKVLVGEAAGLTQKRRALAFAGIIAITLVLDERGRVAAEPAIIIDGIPEPVRDAIRAAAEKAISLHRPKRDDSEVLKENVRRAARRAAHDAWGKKPVTRVEAVWV
jgi:ribonuclease J